MGTWDSVPKKCILKDEVSLFCSFQENIFLPWHDVEVPTTNSLEQQMHPLVFIWQLNIPVLQNYLQCADGVNFCALEQSLD